MDKGNSSTRGIPRIKFFKTTMFSLTLLILVIITGIYWPTTYFHPYKGIKGIAFAASLGKPLNLQIVNRGFWGIFKGDFPLGDEISVINEKDTIRTEMSAVGFAAYNAGMGYFGPACLDWVSQSRRFLDAPEGMKNKLGYVVLTRNFSMGFTPVNFNEFYSKSRRSESHMTEPYLAVSGMRGLEKGFDRNFADNRKRRILPRDTWLLLRPNTQGIFRNSELDESQGAQSIEAEESLPLAFHIYSNLCDWKTGEWDKERTRWLVSRQYAVCYGIYLDPDLIGIKGRGINTRFTYSGKPPVKRVVIGWKKGDIIVETLVKIMNRKKELCFFGSANPDQSIVIPFSYLHRMNDEDTILLSGGNVITNFQEILEEISQVRINKRTRPSMIYATSSGGSDRQPLGYDLSPYVVISEPLSRIANKAMRNVVTKEEAVANMMRFLVENLPYSSDHKGDTRDPSYKGPREIPMSPLIAFLNGREDCEGHAIMATSLYMSASHPAVSHENRIAGLESLDHDGIGHVISLLPDVGKPVTDLFPNHVKINLDGVPVLMSRIEATGLGGNKLHQTRPQRRGYTPEYATIIDLRDGGKRRVRIIGFSQYNHYM